MIGLFFFFAIGLWVWIAVKLGTKIPQWLGVTRYRKVLSVLLISLIFVAPVADEIIAYPQMMALCAARENTHLVVDEKAAYGRTVYYTQSSAAQTLWPPSVVILRHQSSYVDAVTKQPILVSSWVTPVHGFLDLPAGSSGDKMTLLLRACKTQENDIARHAGGVLQALRHLNWTVVPTP